MNVKEIVVSDQSLESRARNCSALLNLPINKSPQSNCYLEFSSKGTYFHNTELNLSYQHSFLSSKIQQRGQAQNQHILKAFKAKKITINSVLDVTAGWCRDSFILASNGFNVTAIEQSPPVYYLNQFAIEEYQQQKKLGLKIQLGNAVNFLSHTNETFDAIYLDPMFPQHKNQAKNKKELQVLQALTHNTDITSLFEIALQKAKFRTVVKRPLHADFINDKKPDFQYLGKTIRFDVYQQFNNK